MEKFLIAGLGNIGAEYAHTRHNIGFDVLDTFAAKHNTFFQNERLADVAEVKLKGRLLICIKPTTYMNHSGKTFLYWLNKKNIDINRFIQLENFILLSLSLFQGFFKIFHGN